MKQSSSTSPVNATLKVIGGQWKLLILWYLSQETLRFNELTRRLSGVTQKMLAQQLRELEAAGLVVRKVYPEVPPKVDYAITDYGKTLEPVLKAMAEWSVGKAEHQPNLASEDGFQVAEEIS